jgi:hypothetical protein
MTRATISIISRLAQAANADPTKFVPAYWRFSVKSRTR